MAIMEAQEGVGQSLSPSFDAGYVILSLLSSIVGSWTTLELLHRRTDNRGLYNW